MIFGKDRPSEGRAPCFEIGGWVGIPLGTSVQVQLAEIHPANLSRLSFIAGHAVSAIDRSEAARFKWRTGACEKAPCRPALGYSV